MKRETKTLKNRTPKGRLNFSMTRSSFLGKRMTANSVAEVVERCPKNWEIIEFRNDDGHRVCVTKEFIDEGMTIEEVIVDWLEYASESELEERITAMGPEFGITLEW